MQGLFISIEISWVTTIGQTSFQTAIPGSYRQHPKRLSRMESRKNVHCRKVDFVNSVLSAKPIFFMSVFLLPKWVIKKIDVIRRRFLWHGHKESQSEKNAMCLVNWRVITMSKEYDGLGVKDLQIMNKALLAK
jgi:hypothetical protein